MVDLFLTLIWDLTQSNAGDQKDLESVDISQRSIQVFTPKNVSILQANVKFGWEIFFLLVLSVQVFVW